LRVGRFPHLWSSENRIVHVVHHIIVARAVIAILVGKHANTAYTATDGTTIGLNLGPEVGRVEHHAVHAGLPSALCHDGRRTGRRVVGEGRMMKIGACSGKVQTARMAR